VINFRYHVVSLTAVFLALAIGLVVGTAALNGPLADDLSDRVSGLSQQNNQLREQFESMKDEVGRQEDFAVQAAPHLLAGQLTGRRVALVSLPAANEYADGAAEMLTMAGAKITRIDIQDKMTDPANNDELLRMAYEPPVSVGTLPRNLDGVESSSALLAAVLLDRKPAVPAPDRTKVLTAYRDKGYIAVNGQVTDSAEAIVVIANTPYVDRGAAGKNKAARTAVTQFDEAGPIVLAGTGVSGTGNVVNEVRGDPALKKTISTVDNVNTPQGRIVTVLALAEQLRPGAPDGTVRVGHYGIQADTLMPKPAE
jgi:hypothetical protein